MAGWTPISPWKPIAGSSQQLSVTSGSSSATTSGVGANTQAVRIAVSGNAHVRFGPAPVASLTDMVLRASDPPEILGIAPGDKIAAIGETGTAVTVNITEMTH